MNFVRRNIEKKTHHRAIIILINMLRCLHAQTWASFSEIRRKYRKFQRFRINFVVVHCSVYCTTRNYIVELAQCTRSFGEKKSNSVASSHMPVPLAVSEQRWKLPGRTTKNEQRFSGWWRWHFIIWRQSVQWRSTQRRRETKTVCVHLRTIRGA